MTIRATKLGFLKPYGPSSRADTSYSTSRMTTPRYTFPNRPPAFFEGPTVRVQPPCLILQPRLALGGPSLTAGEWVLIRSVPTVVLAIAQLMGLHTGLVLAVLVSPEAAGLGTCGRSGGRNSLNRGVSIEGPLLTLRPPTPSWNRMT